MEVLRWCAEATRFMRSLVLRGGSGMEVLRGSSGTSILPRTPRRQTGTDKRHPFEVYVSGVIEDGGQVSVVPGTVNQFLPPTIGGAGEDMDEEIEGTPWVFDIPSAAERWIVLRAELAGDGLVTGAELSCEEEIPEQPEGNAETGSAPPASYRVLARVFWVEDVLKVENYVLGSQWVQTCVSQWNCNEQVVRVFWVDQALLPL